MANPTNIGTGPDTLAISLAEDAYRGDAQFVVTVDGTQIGGTQTVTALNSAGASQVFNVLGSFAAGEHTVGINFLNDDYGGTATTDRNLYVTGATFNGAAVANASLLLAAQGVKTFSFTAPGSTTTTPTPSTVNIGSGPNTLALSISEDAYQGNAQFTISVDGNQIGGTQTASALRSAGASQVFNVAGSFGAGSHTVSVNFLNDAWGGTSSTDRNLFVNSATLDGVAIGNSRCRL